MSSLGDIAKGTSPRSGGLDTELRQKLLAAYKRMLAYQFFGTLLLGIVFVIVLVVSWFNVKANATWQPPILIVATLAGILGALFSALTRLYRVDQLPLALMSDTVLGLERIHLMVYSIVPPIVGALAAVVVYMLFVSGLVDGGAFPKLVCKAANKTCSDLVQVLNDYGPEKAADYGKALIWTFAAGFTERLVPDMLQAVLARMQRESVKA